MPYKTGYGRYSRKRPKGSFARVIAEIPNNEAEAVDLWGIEAEMPSRTAAIRELLKAGLEAKKASGQSPNLPDASQQSLTKGNRDEHR